MGQQAGKGNTQLSPFRPLHALHALCLFLSVWAAAWTQGCAARPTDFFQLVRGATESQVRETIRKGADVNARAGAGFTPLMAAASDNRRPEVIVALLRAGAELDAWDDLSMTALNWAAAHNQNPEVIAALIKAGADLESRDIGGDTPLMFAARYNPNVEVLGVLLGAGADLTAEDHTGETALSLAARYNGPAVLSALLRAGADAKAKDALGMNAFDWSRGNARLAGSAALRQLQAACSPIN